jgi:hypothetical protein
MLAEPGVAAFRLRVNIDAKTLRNVRENFPTQDRYASELISDERLVCIGPVPEWEHIKRCSVDVRGVLETHCFGYSTPAGHCLPGQYCGLLYIG